MKSFHLTLWTVLLLFTSVMLFVTLSTFSRKSNSCKIDPSQIKQLREISKT